jgi:hypothetical protein
MNRREFMKGMMGVGISLCSAPFINTFGMKEVQRKFFMKNMETQLVTPIWTRRTIDRGFILTKSVTEWTMNNGKTWNDISVPIMIETIL